MPTPNGNLWYQAVNVNRGSCLDVFGWGTALGTALDQWTCGNGQANQQWQFTPIGNGIYQVHSRSVAMSWNVTGGTGATGNSVPIQLWSYGGSSNEQWQAVYLRTDGGATGLPAAGVTSTKVKACALVPLHENWSNCLPFAVEARGTSRQSPLF